MNAAVECTGLAKRFGDVVAVDGLDLHITTGECFGLLGPNGAGKTTTVEILQGLLTPDAGSVSILGREWTSDAHALRQSLGSQLQETLLPDKLSVQETIELFASFYRRAQSPDRVLAMVQLEEKRAAWVRDLSGGQKQRLAVACALVNTPELLFLDEPTTGLDPQSRIQMWSVVTDLRSEGTTVVLTTHYMEEAQRLCDRVAVVDHGKVIALGTPHELISSLGAEHVVEFALHEVNGVTVESLESLPGVAAVSRDEERFRLTVTAVHETVPALMDVVSRQEGELADLRTYHATLEDVFISLTGRHLRDG